MRLTINIEDDILEEVKAIAEREKKLLGQVVSAMLRRAVEPNHSSKKKTRNGIPLFPVAVNARPVTPELILELLEN